MKYSTSDNGFGYSVAAFRLTLMKSVATAMTVACLYQVSAELFLRYRLINEDYRTIGHRIDVSEFVVGTGTRVDVPTKSAARCFVIHYSSTDCGVCVANLNEWKAFATQAGLDNCEVLDMSNGPAQQFSDSKGSGNQVRAVSVGGAEAIKLSRTPTTVILNTDRRVIWWFEGPVRQDQWAQINKRLGLGPLVYLKRELPSLLQTEPGKLIRVDGGLVGPVEHFAYPGRVVFGASTARVTIVEFGDFQCPFCAQTFKSLKEIERVYPDDVSLVFRQFPLEGHKYAYLAAEAAISAALQKRFNGMYEALYESSGQLNDQKIEQIARDIALDMKKFRNSTSNQETIEEIENDRKEAIRLGVDGTPTLFINGRRFAGPVSFKTLKLIIDRALASPSPETL